jgi:hypothetical protein
MAGVLLCVVKLFHSVFVIIYEVIWLLCKELLISNSIINNLNPYL